MSSPKTPSTTTQITQQQRPAYVEQGFQERYLPGIYAAYEQPYRPYTGQRVAGFNPQQQSGMQLAAQRAVSGSPITNAAGRNLTSTLQGDYLDVSKNPAWAPISQGIADAYRTGTAAQTDRAFAQSRALGGSAYNEATQRNQAALGSALAGAAGNLYNTERGYQMQAAGMAPQLAAEDYTDAQALMGIGDVQRQYEQDLLNQQLQDYYQQINYPQQQLQLLGGGLGTAMTGALSQQAAGPNPYRPNPTAGALGGAASGAGLGSSFGPYGALIGGLLGAGAGYYGSR
jgi:hypothetical protein